MANIKWIKIVTDIFDDTKILMLEAMPEAHSLIVVWFKILCLCGKEDNSGVLRISESIYYTDEILATIFRMPLNTVRLALKAFVDLGMIEIIDDVIVIPNWGKHQASDSLDKKREYQKKYMREVRAKQKLLVNSSSEERIADVRKTLSNSKANGDTNVSDADKIRQDKIRQDIDKTRQDISNIELDPNAKDVCEILKRYKFDINTNTGNVETLISYLDQMEIGLFDIAFEIAQTNQKNNLNYILKILNNWLKEGRTTVAIHNQFESKKGGNNGNSKRNSENTDDSNTEGQWSMSLDDAEKFFSDGD